MRSPVIKILWSGSAFGGQSTRAGRLLIDVRPVSLPSRFGMD